MQGSNGTLLVHSKGRPLSRTSDLGKYLPKLGWPIMPHSYKRALRMTLYDQFRPRFPYDFNDFTFTLLIERLSYVI